jgi:hypothetical protein
VGSATLACSVIDPTKVAFFIPGHLRSVKLALFNRIATGLERAGGKVIRGNLADLTTLPMDMVPLIGCTPELRPLIDGWVRQRRRWAYWDRGYYFRTYATWLPRGENGGMYRAQINSYQMQRLRDVPADRLDARRPPVTPWRKGGKHIVIAAPTITYSRFHALKDWTDVTVDALARVTDRQLVIRGKETRRPLQSDLQDAHALVSHGSIAAVEAVICGCPVFVHPDSAAALVGLTDLAQIERPVYPDREPWLRALAYSHFSEAEMANGTLWRLME